MRHKSKSEKAKRVCIKNTYHMLSLTCAHIHDIHIHKYMCAHAHAYQVPMIHFKKHVYMCTFVFDSQKNYSYNIFDVLFL